MKKTELQEIADLLANSYGSGRHYEITKAVKSGEYWDITLKCADVTSDDDEGAKNESDK